jgi:HPt (histidine-containing phosphotransfer) domain-containing protein
VAQLSGLAKRQPAGEHGDGSEGREFRIPRELLPLLHDELGEQLQGLRHAFHDNDVERMRDHAHQLKGLAGYFGLTEFHEQTGVLQQAIIAGKQAEITDLLARLETTAGRFLDPPTRADN